MSWILLLGAIVFDVVATLALAFSQGFTHALPTAIAVLSILASLWLFSLALRTLEVGIAYAVFCGLGIAVTAIIGILWLGEAVSPLKLVALGLACLGVALLPIADHANQGTTQPVQNNTTGEVAVFESLRIPRSHIVARLPGPCGAPRRGLGFSACRRRNRSTGPPRTTEQEPSMLLAPPRVTTPGRRGPPHRCHVHPDTPAHRESRIPPI